MIGLGTVACKGITGHAQCFGIQNRMEYEPFGSKAFTTSIPSRAQDGLFYITELGEDP